MVTLDVPFEEIVLRKHELVFADDSHPLICSSKAAHNFIKKRAEDRPKYANA